MSKTYVTRSGDTFDAIAHRELGNALLMDLVIDANPAHNYVAKFDDGVELTIPDVPDDRKSSSDAVSKIPPWRVA